VEETFAHMDLDWKQYVEMDPRYLRPTEVDILCGDAGKARRRTGLGAKSRLPGAGAHDVRERSEDRTGRKIYGGIGSCFPFKAK